jgi:hypothetical protein
VFHLLGSSQQPGRCEGREREWGSSGSDVFAVADNGPILHYDGVAWSPMSSPDGDFYGVWGSSGSDVFTVGRYGTILHYGCICFSYLSLVLKTR